MYRHGFLLAIMFCLSQNVVVAYPSGAPITACDSMTPGHGTASNVACPFVTIFDKTEMFSNGTLNVTLKAPTSITKTFKGFMVMGFHKATSAVIGTFKISSTNQYSKTLDCSQYDNAATHKNDNKKSSISMDWIPPQGFGGDVEFKTTFLEDKDYNYWVKEISETIRITASEPLPTIPTTESANTELPIPDPYVGCGETKGCIATPDGCVATKTCAMMTTYKKFDNANLVLEIYGEVIGDQYVAVGFSTDPEMGSDSVVECVQYRDTPKTYQSYNTPDHNNIRLTNLQVTEEMSSMSVDGYIYCSVKHPIVFKNSNQDFDLNQPHYILMATGTTGKDNIQRHFKEEKSSSSINLTSDLGISYYKESTQDFSSCKPDSTISTTTNNPLTAPSYGGASSSLQLFSPIHFVIPLFTFLFLQKTSLVYVW